MAVYAALKSSSCLAFIQFFLFVFGYPEGYQERIPNVDHHYPIHIGAENHIVQGRVSAEAENGDLVPSNIVLEGNHDADDMLHLRVEVRESVYKRPHVFHLNHKDNTSSLEFPNGTLPDGMIFVIIHSDAFYVNDDRFIAVKDLSHLKGETKIHFDVILKDTLAVTKYVSNHLPFVVEIEYPKRDLNPNAVLFAGVLVFMILAISLIIPFAVRTKRRCKAGKPIFKCGSSDDSSDVDTLEYLRKRANSIGGKDNLAMMLETGRMKCERPSVDQHMTIGNHMLRSTSSFNFQPHWLDPHYNDVYVRPDYSHHNIHAPLDKQESAGSSNGAALTREGSARSSQSSCINYPENFNKNIDKRVRIDNGVKVILGDKTASGILAKGGHALKATESKTTDSSKISVSASSPLATKCIEKF